MCFAQAIFEASKEQICSYGSLFRGDRGEKETEPYSLELTGFPHVKLFPQRGDVW